MLGKNRYKVINDADMSNDRLLSLISFYLPLMDAESISLYQYLLFERDADAREISDLLNELSISIDSFESSLEKLNCYDLVKTWKREEDDLYLLELNAPLNRSEFVANDLYVRNFILRTSGAHFQKLLSRIPVKEKRYRGFEDVSKHFDPSVLSSWSLEDERYLSEKEEEKKEMEFNTLFDVNRLLADMSDFLFPLRFRTYDNLKEIATLADLYSISYDGMRNIIAKVVRSDKDTFDKKELQTLCRKAAIEYQQVEKGSYNTPNVQYLMSLQGGKKVTRYDKEVLYNLAHEYKLPTPVINVLIEYSLKQCDNRLIEKYIYAVAADLHRNDVKTVEQAKMRLERNTDRKEKEVLPEYDSSVNPALDEKRLEELLKRRKTNE